jgi:hypothetical protein
MHTKKSNSQLARLVTHKHSQECHKELYRKPSHTNNLAAQHVVVCRLSLCTLCSTTPTAWTTMPEKPSANAAVTCGQPINMSTALTSLLSTYQPRNSALSLPPLVAHACQVLIHCSRPAGTGNVIPAVAFVCVHLSLLLSLTRHPIPANGPTPDCCPCTLLPCPCTHTRINTAAALLPPWDPHYLSHWGPAHHALQHISASFDGTCSYPCCNPCRTPAMTHVEHLSMQGQLLVPQGCVYNKSNGNSCQPAQQVDAMPPF